MSRVAKMPVDLPQGVSATIGADVVTVKGAKGTLTLSIKSGIKVVQQDKHLEVQASTNAEGLNAIAGATRAHLANMVTASPWAMRRSSNWSASVIAPRFR